MRHLCRTKLNSLSSSSSSGPVLLLLRGSHAVSRRQEEASREVRVSVWWDFENCNVPTGTNVFKIAHTITAAIRANGIKGPIEITAFGDMLQLSRARQEGLSATGINLTHIPTGGRNSADRSLLLSLMFWVSQNPPPAHLLLISGDRDFASTLHRLRMSNYNILLATPETAPGVLCSAASIMWNWHDLLRGENLIGKYFNQPPDGPYGSWYGHYKVPLEDPFSEANQQACLQSEQSSVSKSCAKLGIVPKGVVKQICKILEGNPKGIFISDFRLELDKALNLDKDYYGFKKFLPFLLSLDNILKLKRVNGSNYIVRGVSQRVDFEDNIGTANGLSNDHEDGDGNEASGLNCDNKSVQGSVDSETSLPTLLEKSSSSLPSNLNENDGLGNTQKNSPRDKNMIKMANTDEKMFETAIVDENIAKTVDAPESDNQIPRGDENIVETVSVRESDFPVSVPVVVKQDSLPVAGLFRKFWRKWFGSKISSSDNKSSKGEEKCEGKESNVDIVLSSSRSSSFNESAHENRTSSTPAASMDKPVNPGFIDRIQHLCKFFNATSAYDKPSGVSSEWENPIIKDASLELFLKDSFWSSVESFLNTSQGSVLVTKSTTRETMAHNFQSKGPACLQSLRENDLLRLVDLLISEKKWVEESPSEVFPFKLTRVEKSRSHHGSNGLSSIFLSSKSQPDAKILANHNIKPKSGYVSHDVEEKFPVKSRDAVLADCQNLVNEIMKEHPEGFFVGLFRKHFLESYGYHLDLNKLGFPNLATLLRTLSGLKVEFGYIVPHDNNPPTTLRVEDIFRHKQENVTHAAVSYVQLPDSSKNDDGTDSLWDELGPVAAKKPAEKETDYEFEPAMSDDESSDSEDTCPSVVGEGNLKAQMEEECGSLLQILDSWHTRKASESCKGPLADSDLAPNAARFSSSGLSQVETMHTMPSIANERRKQSSQKSYIFVADSVSDENNDKLVNGIFGNLRKPANELSKKGRDKLLCE